MFYMTEMKTVDFLKYLLGKNVESVMNTRKNIYLRFLDELIFRIFSKINENSCIKMHV